MKNYTFFAFIFLFVACNRKQTNTLPTVLPQKASVGEFGQRYSITGDFNRDGITDTIKESYTSMQDGKEMNKIQDSGDFDNNLVLLKKAKPKTILYCSIKGVDPFVVTDNFQQSGIYCFENLGDLNEDGGDEFGYMISWEDWSSINEYSILTIKNNKIKKLFAVPCRDVYLDEPFNVKDILKKTGPKTIEYKDFMEGDAGVMVAKKHMFK